MQSLKAQYTTPATANQTHMPQKKLLHTLPCAAKIIPNSSYIEIRKGAFQMAGCSLLFLQVLYLVFII